MLSALESALRVFDRNNLGILQQKPVTDYARLHGVEEAKDVEVRGSYTTFDCPEQSLSSVSTSHYERETPVLDSLHRGGAS